VENMNACENSGHSVLDDFAEVSKIVDAGVISNEEFAIFLKAGYMGSTELIANLFRMVA
jgi:DNA-damage-inducible protein D